MKDVSQAVLGVLSAFISIALLLGAFSLSFLESGSLQAALISPTLTETPTDTFTPHPTYVPGEPTFTPTNSPTPTETPTPRPICPPPEGWIPVLILPGDTLQSVADRYNTTPEELYKRNCLNANMLLDGGTIYVPEPSATPTSTNIPTATRTAIPCGPPAGWVRYLVQTGDNLFRIAEQFDTSIQMLQLANCMGNSEKIIAGTYIYVPNVPTRTPTPTSVPPTLTQVPPTPVLPTEEIPPTEPPTPVPTVEPSSTPDTPVVIETPVDVD